MWRKTYGTGKAYGVIQTIDGGYVLVGNDPLFSLIKTDSEGNMQYNRTFPFQVYSIIQTKDEGYALTGYAKSSGTDYDVWLAKTDANGNMQWHKTYGGLNCNLYLYEWLAPYPALQTDDGGYAIISSTVSFDANDVDAWLIKTDSEGNLQWNKTYGGPNDEYASKVVKALDGGYLIAGWTESFGAGGRDSWIVKTDSQGNMQWNKTSGGVTYDYFFSLLTTADGGYIATRSIQDQVGSMFFSAEVLKIDSSGNPNESIRFPFTDDMMGKFANFIILTDDGGYIFTGHETTADDPHVARNYVWLVKLSIVPASSATLQPTPTQSASPLSTEVPGQFGFSWVEVALAVAVLAVGGAAAYFLRRSQKRG